MPKISILRAPVPITKSYTKEADGTITKQPYPFVYEVSSTDIQANNLVDLHNIIAAASKNNQVLLKGQLSRPLVEESRAGSTDADTDTEWICLDLDGIENIQSVDHFLQEIGLADIDYVLQWSSSMGIENQKGFRCHIFMLLDKPAHPALLKQWLTFINLNTPVLASQLQLTKTGSSLRWPLDITTCQNDKLIYVAPPILNNLPDPYPGNRITLNTRSKRYVSMPATVPSKTTLREMIDVKVNELREKEGLPKRRKSKYKYDGSTEYLENPDEAEITGIKLERGFVYFNLNGGDSWAYFHPEDNPFFIHNFKGEPAYRTQDLLPKYWAKLVQRVKAYEPDAQGLVYLAFRDISTATYYNGVYDTAADELKLYRAGSKDQLRDFMKQHGQPFEDYVPDWTLVFEPLNNSVIDLDKKVINTYQPSSFFKIKPIPNANPPQVVHKIVSHVLGGDADTIEHFYNWLACIAQHRERTGTAWVLQGTQGTGKGLLFHHILAPIFGTANVVSKRMDEIESNFTGFMQNKSIVFIDEIEAGSSLYHNKITAKLKNLIVEPTISVRHMYQEAKEIRNYSNMIFASNKPDPVEVAPDDRRFNVGGYQMQRLVISTQEVEVQLPKELIEFYHYLSTRPADRDKARTPHQNEARRVLQDISTKSADVVATAIIKGDLEFLWQNLVANKMKISPVIALTYEPFRELVIELVQNPSNSKLSREDLFTIFQWTVGGMSHSPNKFTSYLKHHRITLKNVNINNQTRRGIDIGQWNYDPLWLTQAQAAVASGLV